MAGTPLEAVYPLIFFDALRVKVRDRVGAQQGGDSRWACAPMAARKSGPLARTERGRQIRLRVMNELKPWRRGRAVAVVDGLNSSRPEPELERWVGSPAGWDRRDPS